MSYGLWALVIFLTFVAGMLGLGFWMTRHDQDVPVERMADPRPLPDERELAYCRKDMNLMHPIGECPYDPPELRDSFPGTAPLLDAELLVMGDALVRDTHEMCEARSREVDEMARRADQLGMMQVDEMAVRTADAAPQDQL